jgi:hypothetical protein
MDIDYGAIAILLLFRGVLGLAVGVALGNALRDLRTRKIFAGAIGLAHAGVYAALVAFMHVSIEAYNEYPFIYWGVFALTVLAGTFKTDSVLKTLSLALFALFGGSFFFVGGWMILSGLRLGLFANIANLIGGVLFMLVGGAVLGALIYPYLKDKSI